MSAPAPVAPVRIWIEAVRPRTLVAGAAPVCVGTAAAGVVIAWRFLAALVVALALQIAVNLANDLFDALKGVDTPERAGPRRAVASGLVDAREMKTAIAVALSIAAVAGLALSLAAGLELLVVGAASMAAALAYSGGPRPYGSFALGEVFVLVFFGLVATVGSAYVQTGSTEAVAVAAALPVGLLAVALLVANNARDAAGDRRAGKRTLAVKLGPQGTVVLFRAVVIAAFVSLAPVALSARSAWPLLALLAAPAARAPLTHVGAGDARALVGALVATARLELVFAALLAAGLWLGR